MTVPAPEYLAKRLATRGLIILGPRANGTYNKGDIPTSFSIEPASASPTSLSGLAPGSVVPGTDGSLAVAGPDGVPVVLADSTDIAGLTEDIGDITTELAAIVAENTDVVIPIDLTCRIAASGTWTLTRVSAALWVLTRTAAASPQLCAFMAQVRQRTTTGKGFKVTGCVMKYKVATADLNDVTIDGNVTVMPATGSAVAAATSLGTVTYDAAHDTSAERKAQGEHTMTVTFGTPIYLNANDEVEIAVTCDGTASGVLTINKISLLGAETLVDAS